MSMFVHEVMSRAPVVVGPGMDAQEAAALMAAEDVDVLVVVAAGVVVGVVGTADLADVASRTGESGGRILVGEVCSAPRTVAWDEDLESTRRLMRHTSMDRLVVLDEGEPVGLVTWQQASTDHQ